MPQFFCFRDSEVQCQNIDYGFAATGHHTCHTPGVGIRVCEFQNVLNDDKGTASGNCTQKHKRKKLHGDTEKIEERTERKVNEIDKSRGGKTVYSQINSNHKRENVNCCFKPLFGSVYKIVLHRGLFCKAVCYDYGSHHRKKTDRDCGKNGTHREDPFLSSILQTKTETRIVTAAVMMDGRTME